MERKAVSVMMLTLLLASMLALASSIQQVESTGFTEVCGVDITDLRVLFKIVHIFVPVDSGYWTWTVYISVTVLNNGTIPINCTVNAYYFDATATYSIGTQTVTNLDPYNSTTLMFPLHLSDLQEDFIYTVKANATCPCGASDEFIGGLLYLRGWGDVDGNGKIDILDVKKIKIIYSGLIDITEIPWADLDGDGAANILDLKKERLICSGLL